MPPKTLRKLHLGPCWCPKAPKGGQKGANKESKVNKFCLGRACETSGIYCVGATWDRPGGRLEPMFFRGAVRGPSWRPVWTHFFTPFSIWGAFWCQNGAKMSPNGSDIRLPFCIFLHVWPFLSLQVHQDPPNRRKTIQKLLRNTKILKKCNPNATKNAIVAPCLLDETSRPNAGRVQD